MTTNVCGDETLEVVRAVIVWEMRLRLHCAGLSILDFNSESALEMNQGATVMLERCTFSRNTIEWKWGSSGRNGLIPVRAVSATADDLPSQDTILLLKQCSIFDNTATDILVSSSEKFPFTYFDAKIYSDEEREVYYQKTADVIGTTLPLDQAPANRPGIGPSTPWFATLQEVWRLSFVIYGSVFFRILT